MALTKDQESHALTLHREALVIDFQCDGVLATLPDSAYVIGDADHMGLGSDFDGAPMIARSLDDASKLPNLTKSLVARGYSDGEIKGILGGNFLRVIKKIRN